MSSSGSLLARLLPLCLCVEALVAVSEIRPGSAGREPVADPRPSATTLKPAGWLVRVDGWTLGVDEVARGALATLLLPIPPESVDPQVPPAGGFPFQDLIVSTAIEEGLDWRLVAAIIAEESGFDPTSESEAGAFGLMQVRPIAALDVGEDDFHSPSGNVRTGVRYLKRLMDLFPVPDPHQQLALVLAAYNMGPAHLSDAQALAERYGLTPQRWYDSVELVLPLLEEPAVYSRLPNGYAQGRQTLRYVRRVLDRYERLRQSQWRHAPGMPARAF
jgi:soluble lytic murein transglycosylase-like protein